jgi:uncharacterized repeat protein (TIGR03837 family)
VSLFRAERPRIVLECYACGRPDWFESILFDSCDHQPRHIVNLEYLTAESWASDFHRLPSLTRSALVRKSVFMPGIRPGTGGLLIDEQFRALVETCASPEGRRAVRRAALERLFLLEPRIGRAARSSGASESAFWFLIFSYEHDFSPIIADLAAFHASHPLVAIVAAGRNSGPFFDAWNRAGAPFPALSLPLLEQPLWDSFLVASDFSIVRGEESFARACLAGHPFLWQCYPFAESDSGGPDTGGQLPKVDAFLNAIRPYFAAGDFTAYERLTAAFNGAVRAGDSLVPMQREPDPGDLLAFLGSPDDDSIGSAFSAFSRDVRNLGNMAVNLMTYLRDLG